MAEVERKDAGNIEIQREAKLKDEPEQDALERDNAGKQQLSAQRPPMPPPAAKTAPLNPAQLEARQRLFESLEQNKK